MPNISEIEKMTPSQKRDTVVVIAQEYTKINISYMSKNSSFNVAKVVKDICNIYLTNDTLKSAFSNRVKPYHKVLNNN